MPEKVKGKFQIYASLWDQGLKDFQSYRLAFFFFGFALRRYLLLVQIKILLVPVIRILENLIQ